METRRWTNPSQPQTLYIAVVLLYIDAAFSLLLGGFSNPIILALAVASVIAGYGIANEKRWAYWLGVAVAGLYLAPFIFYMAAHGISSIMKPTLLIDALFPVALFVLLIHPLSREYQRIWFD